MNTSLFLFSLRKNEWLGGLSYKRYDVNVRNARTLFFWHSCVRVDTISALSPGLNF